MKRNTLLALMVTSVLALASAALATDYSGYSLKELSQMRCNMMNMSQEDRDAFRSAWREKMQRASDQDRQMYAWGQGNCRGKKGHSNCMGSGCRKGHGSRHGHGYESW